MSALRGWCPSAWRPMRAGDGLLLRLRPPLARLTRAQALLVAELATAYGNGAIDLTRRAALQLRGLDEAGWRAAVDRLVSAGLVDPDPAIEAVALTVAPDWGEGDDTHRVARALMARRAELPPLPAKFGIAVDAGDGSVLGDTPADLRVERGADGGLILRADGRATGAPLRRGREVEAIAALADWFVTTGGAVAGRMARHPAVLPAWASGCVAPLVRESESEQVTPRYGRLTGAELASLAAGVEALRVTPWRSLLMERDAARVPPPPSSSSRLSSKEHAGFGFRRTGRGDVPATPSRPNFQGGALSRECRGSGMSPDSPEAPPLHQASAGPPPLPSKGKVHVSGAAQARSRSPLASAPPDVHVDACVGAPACPRASVVTRALADRLAAAPLAGPIHVSGCAKGCARSAPAALTIVGRGGRYDLVRDGRADSPPVRRDLTAAALLAHLGAD
ncbi:cobalamin biosynthesis protein CobG [Sphingomonas sp. BK580]|uniref:cobalamin biosynthesis protein CobG n=1 Tax=Sphingomonas sp. BK580 TaxID=2586972 RepID=UPI00179C5E69|nr:cobalamin biosynthesis protein CobG [Sphingomonas sp. BK580]MBB3692858.1 precorrin-3B synthase [Sphingomonas sp. BK580]